MPAVISQRAAIPMAPPDATIKRRRKSVKQRRTFRASMWNPDIFMAEVVPIEPPVSPLRTPKKVRFATPLKSIAIIPIFKGDKKELFYSKTDMKRFAAKERLRQSLAFTVRLVSRPSEIPQYRIVAVFHSLVVNYKIESGLVDAPNLESKNHDQAQDRSQTHYSTSPRTIFATMA